MGQAKVKQTNRQKLLVANPSCIYCGAPATTTDHCPPRCFFVGRVWPESYEFPACELCNKIARLDEQALGALIRIKISRDYNLNEILEIEKLMRGISNNQPEILREWRVSSRTLRDTLRDMFGRVDGDQLRREGWGALNLGPLTKAAATRFRVKLGQALYYLHNRKVLDGVVYSSHISALEKEFDPQLLVDMLGDLPAIPSIRRNAKTLHDQFIYRFNNHPEWGVVHAVVQFSEQFIFQILAMRKDTEERLLSTMPDAEKFGSFDGRQECYLKAAPAYP